MEILYPYLMILDSRFRIKYEVLTDLHAGGLSGACARTTSFPDSSSAPLMTQNASVSKRNETYSGVRGVVKRLLKCSEFRMQNFYRCINFAWFKPITVLLGKHKKTGENLKKCIYIMIHISKVI